MKHLKSKSKEIKDLFKNSILVRDIYENLKYCNVNDDASIVQKTMEELDFDVYGLEDNHVISGYVEQFKLREGICGDYQKIFHPSELIAESTPLLDVLPILRDNQRIFVLERNQVTGIVTRGDLQKAPIRMLLFGLISLLEMNLQKIIRIYYPYESWENLLSKKRIENVKDLLVERKKRNEAIDLIDCLQFCDKRTIIMKNKKIINKIWNGSMKSIKTLLKNIEALRDRLAHSQDIVAGSSWQEIIDLTKKIDILLQQCEEMIHESIN